MLGPQTEVEIRIWCDEVSRCRKRCVSPATAMDFADSVLAAYRLRYGLPPTAADDRLGKAAIEAMDALLKVLGEDRHDEFTIHVIDRIATQYVAARWHIEKETGK